MIKLFCSGQPLPVYSPVFLLGAMMRRTMRVRTVRMVATALREPWWSSILMRSFLGCVKLTAKWPSDLESLPCAL
jgi:hypothetical protein